MHLCFADDLVIFAKADAPSVSKIMVLLKNFGECSGLLANLQKSNLFIAGVADYGPLQSITGFSLGSMLFRYLGIPIAGYKLQIGHYSAYISKLLLENIITLLCRQTRVDQVDISRYSLSLVKCFTSSHLCPTPSQPYLLTLSLGPHWPRESTGIGWLEECLST